MTTQFNSFAAMGAHLATVALSVHAAQAAALDSVGKHLQKKVQGKFGTYQPQAGQFHEWAPLADATVEGREARGYPGDEPLLVTGDLQKSVGYQRNGNVEVNVGSNSDIAVYQEIGTVHIPPRSFLGATAVEEAGAIVAKVGQMTVLALVGAGVKDGSLDILHNEIKTP